MYINFSVVEINTDLINKTITIIFSADVDPNTVNNKSIELIEKDSRNAVNGVFLVESNIVTITLNDYPVPNVEYVINITSDVKSLIEQEIDCTIRRIIKFQSDILNTTKIISPSNYEEVNAFEFTWEEIINNKSEQNQYFIEVSTDNAFYNIELSTIVTDKKTIKLFKDLPIGQYFVRVRCQTSNTYGLWSDIVTFIYKPAKQDDISDIYVEPLEIVTEPTFNEDSFLIEFDSEIDMNSLIDKIVLLRSDY